MKKTPIETWLILQVRTLYGLGLIEAIADVLKRQADASSAKKHYRFQYWQAMHSHEI